MRGYQIPDGYVACGYQLRIYPTDRQKAQFFKSFGSVRYVFNQYKACFDERYRNNQDLTFPNESDLKILLPTLKQEHAWLKDVDSTALQFTVETYSKAKWDYIKHKKGNPHFKSRKYYKQSYTSKNINNNIRFIDNYSIKLPKLKTTVKTSNSSAFHQMKILRVTISYREDLDRFWLTVNGIKPKPQPFEKTGKAVGIDLGLSSEWLVTSDNYRLSVPKTKELIKRKERLQAITDRRKNNTIKRVLLHNNQYPDSKIDEYSERGWQKARKTKSKLELKIHNIRMDTIHKEVRKLVQNYDVIVIEDLKVSNLLKNHKLAKAISNASWYAFRQTLEYYCDWYDKQLIVVPPQYTSRKCSNCGRIPKRFKHIKTNEWLAVRNWTCPYCHDRHDRDVNAAVNILNKGLAALS